MNTRFRPADERDLDAVCAIYDAVHTEEEAGRAVIGWRRGVYPTRDTAAQALPRGELYVLEADGRVAAAGIINRRQMDAYALGDWKIPAAPEQVLVLHTLVVDPARAGHGLGPCFAEQYEALARRLGCRALRIDTNARNERARRLYKRLGYREAGIVPCVFNGLPDVQLVLLEKGLEP